MYARVSTIESISKIVITGIYCKWDKGMVLVS